MNILIDFHYSNFWADPEHQTAPKVWMDMESPREKRPSRRSLSNRYKISLLPVYPLWAYRSATRSITGSPTLTMKKTATTTVRPIHLICSFQRRKACVRSTHGTLHRSAGTGWALQSGTGAYRSGVDFDVLGTSFYTLGHGHRSLRFIRGRGFIMPETNIAYGSGAC